MLRLGCVILLVWMVILEVKAVSGNNRHFFFTHLQLEDGLSRQSVLTIFQDTEQYIWIGTNDGLDRYDGYGYRRYSKEYEDPYYLDDDYIQKILQRNADLAPLPFLNGALVPPQHIRKLLKHYLFPEMLFQIFFRGSDS